jgi:hypothetical protein
MSTASDLRQPYDIGTGAVTLPADAGKARRYPGAPPFEDTPLAHQLFFGRPAERVVLANRIMANRLVVFYGRSGLGKTSLLKAGVAPLLRDEGFFPIWVRLNVPGQDPIETTFDAVQRSAAQHGMQCVPGLTNSLWHYFKTLQLWRGDTLLTPVLIFDQFEEVFTLQPAEQRDVLIAALAFLVRGVQPPPSAVSGAGTRSPDADSVELSEKPPTVAVVIAIREDFLGSLEELSDRIPQVMDQRFRLRPLNRAAAREAIESPAGVQSVDLATRAFRFEPAATESILDFLSRRSDSEGAAGDQQIEPFQLQLVCQWIEEEIVAKAQAGAQQMLTITAADVGGEKNMQNIMQTFYARQLQRLPGPVRRAVRRLCEERLISPQRRRLSLNEEEIMRDERIDAPTLARLVDGRLLRADRRAGNTYYELSHDTLIGPILATQRGLILLRGSLLLIGGGLAFLLGILGVVLVGWVLLDHITGGMSGTSEDVVIDGCMILLGIPLIFAGRAVWAQGFDLILRRGWVPSTRARRRFYWILAAVFGLVAALCLALLALWQHMPSGFDMAFLVVMSIASLSGAGAAWRRARQLRRSETKSRREHL